MPYLFAISTERHTVVSLMVVLALTVVPVYAQVPDTSDVVQEDTTVAVQDTTVRALVGFFGPEPGKIVVPVLPVLHSAMDATDILAEMPDAFVYRFGTPGWPEGWSPRGISPARVMLTFNSIPFDDPLTGRPRYELLPLEFLEPLRVQQTRFGAPAAVAAQMRPYSIPRPLTELRYRKGDSGFQGISAVHTQIRRLSLFGRQGVVGFLGGYGGRAATGEYPGSRLRRERKLLARIRYARPGLSLELLELYNRREIGAHGGVIPRIPGVFESIYQRLDAAVFQPEATRTTMRNDLILTARTHLLPGHEEPIGVSAFWTSYTARYQQSGQEITGKVSRYGFNVRQEAVLGVKGLQVLIDGWTDRLRQQYADSALASTRRNQLHAALHDSLEWGGTILEANAGYHFGGERAYPTVALGATRGLGSLSLTVSVVSTGQTRAWVEEAGFGEYVHPLVDTPGERFLEGRAEITVSAGAFDFLVSGFYQQMNHTVDFYAPEDDPGVLRSPDTVSVVMAASPFRRAGLTGGTTWRENAERGIYFSARATMFRFLNTNASVLHQRAASSLPQVFAQGRLGARFVLFQDLDLDVYFQGRFWTEMRSRLLHPPTGLLVIPALTDRIIGPSGTLDLVATSGLRSATLFFVYENMLSGTTLTPGNLIVPVYPLPERRIRFGVFWPIFN